MGRPYISRAFVGVSQWLTRFLYFFGKLGLHLDDLDRR